MKKEDAAKIVSGLCDDLADSLAENPLGKDAERLSTKLRFGRRVIAIGDEELLNLLCQLAEVPEEEPVDSRLVRIFDGLQGGPLLSRQHQEMTIPGEVRVVINESSNQDEIVALLRKIAHWVEAEQANGGQGEPGGEHLPC